MSRRAASRSVAGDYAREFDVPVPCERLFDAIATLDGVRGWWTALAGGSDRSGGRIRLRFQGLDEHIDLRVKESRRPHDVAWSVVEHSALQEWAGTVIHFQLSARDVNSCHLTFQHRGLSPRLDCYDDCRMGWDHFLASLIALVTRGRGQPFGQSP